MTQAANSGFLLVRYWRLACAGWTALALICLASAADDARVFAQGSGERVRGVANFGRVTDTYFRGGEVTREGLKNLAGMGVRTVIDLREEADEEEKGYCEQLGMTYYSFPMTTEDTPDPSKVERIVQIIQDAKSPVYVHCSGGKHRTGTVCAYFRIKKQGRSAERAWREQQSYGFGTPEEHSKLFSYIYGDTSVAKRLKPVPVSAAPTEAARPAADGEATAGPASTAKQDPPSGSGGDVKAEGPPHPEGVLSTTANYVALARAIQLARGHGGSGEAIRVNLEYDKKRSAPVWKLLFATGTEYRLNALTGALLGTKTKSEKLSFLSPLDLQRKYWTFQKVIAKAEQRGREKVVEMEFKSVAGRNVTFFEVMMADGVTLFFDAASGHQIRAF